MHPLLCSEDMAIAMHLCPALAPRPLSFAALRSPQLGFPCKGGEGGETCFCCGAETWAKPKAKARAKARVKAKARARARGEAEAKAQSRAQARARVRARG